MTERPDVIPCLKHIAQKAYDAGHWDSTIDTIEETIVELERLRATVVSLQDESAHLRAMNRRMCAALSELMPLGGSTTCYPGSEQEQNAPATLGGDGGPTNPTVIP